MTNHGIVIPTSKFCSSCGNGLVAAAVLCPRCGSPTPDITRKSRGKDKTIAVLLAIFFGGWVWAYLYEKCKAKFLWFMASVVTSIVFVFVAIATIFGSIGNIQNQCQFNQNCPPHFGAGIVVVLVFFCIVWFLTIAMHIYAIVDVVIKNSDWYESF
jgi:predicted RNA-binding Zn-ribbon protein involved in translation (DUF1610 family)